MLFRSIMGLGFDKVEAPDVIGSLGAKPDAGPVIKPETAPFWLFLWDFQPLTTPDALNPVLAYFNATVVQQRRHAPIAIAAIF